MTRTSARQEKIGAVFVTATVTVAVVVESVIGEYFVGIVVAYPVS